MEQKNKHSDTPNFLRLANELSKFKNPYRMADLLLMFVKDGMENSTHTEQSLDLPVGKV